MPRDIDQRAIESPLRVQPQELPKHGCRTTRGGREIKGFLPEARHDAVVDDDAGFVQHQPISGHPDAKVRKPPCVDSIKEESRLRAVNLDFSECADINQAHCVAHCAHLSCNRLVASLPRAGVVLRAAPVASGHPHGAQGGMVGIERRTPLDMKAAAGKEFHRHRVIHRPRSSEAQLAQRYAAGRRQDP